MADLIPRSEAELTPAWLSLVLGTEISPKHFSIQSNIQEGSGTLSNMVRIQCQSSGDNRTYNLVLKLLPPAGVMLDLLLAEGFDKTEVNFYQKVVPDLVRILPELASSFCPFYYGSVSAAGDPLGHASVIVLADLSPDRYYTVNFGQQVSMEKIREVVSFMAKFHFASMALEKRKGQRLDQAFNFLQGTDPNKRSMFYDMVRTGLPDTVKLLIRSGSSPEVISAYRTLCKYSDQLISRVDEEGRKRPCIIHGDLWSSNLLLNDNPELPTKVIDWQSAIYKDPCYDLVSSIVSTLPLDQLSVAVLDQHLRLYYDTWTALCEGAGMGDLVNRDWTEFVGFCHSWAAAHTMQWLLMATAPFAINYPRIIAIYEFLARDLGAIDFVMQYLK